LIARLLKIFTCHAWVSLYLVVCCSFFVLSSSARAGDPILVLRPGTVDFAAALAGTRDELGDECDITELIVKNDTPLDTFKRAYQQVRPRLIVLMEGKSVNLYRRFQESNPVGTTYPPTIVFMTSYARQRIKSLTNATGITYEIQAIQAISKLRELLDRPISRVGTLYTSNLKDFFKDQQQSCKNEEIELIGILIPSGRKVERDIKNGLQKLLKDEKVDAIWVINVVPDYVERGARVGGMILGIKEDNWSLENYSIDKPISVHKKYNPKLIPKGLNLRQNVRDEGWEIIASEE